MGKYILALIFLVQGLFTCSYGETTQQPAQQSTTPPYPFQEEERGLGISVFHDYGNPNAAQFRHLPMYPGYENFSGLVPGIGFTNPNIHFLSIDYDFREKLLFSYDFHLRSIVVGYGYNKDLNITNMDFDFMHVGVSKGTIQIAYDWLSKTLYWSDYVYRWIVAAPTQKERIAKDYYAIIADKHLDGPDGITLDPMEGYLFWSDNGKHPKIERSDMQGKERHSIIYKNLVSPLTLEADIVGKRIYWIDTFTESILSSTYDGKDVIQIQRVPNADLLDLAIFREVIYVSDISNSEVYTLNTTKGLHLGKSESTDISIYPEVIYGLAVYSSETQPLKNKDFCKDKKCDHMCVSTKNGAECICSVGYERKSGKCQETFKKYHKAIVVANATHICLVDIRSFAHMAYGYECRYTAIKQKISGNSQTTSMPPAARRRRQVSSMASTSFLPGPTTMTSFTEPTRRPTTTTTPRPTTTTPPPTAPPGELIKMLDVDTANRIFYFATANNNIYRRPIDLPIENDEKERVVIANGTITGLSFDAADNVIYWCESNGKVKVISPSTNSLRTVTPNNMEITNARAITVLLDLRRLALLSGRTGDVSIQTMTTDGDDYQTVATARDIPAFTYDMENGLIYYIAAARLYSVPLDGGTSTSVFTVSDTNIFHILKYQHYVTWLYKTGPYNHLVRTYDIVTQINVELGYFDNSTLVDMKVLDTALQTTDFISPCVYENGGCQQICITKYENDKMDRICECRLGYSLAPDKMSCRSTVTDDFFILVADWTNYEIQQIDLATEEINVIPDEPSNDYMGVYYDPDRKKVIYAEYYDTKIMSMNLNGTDRRVLSNTVSSGYAYRFDKDFTTKNLYFTAYFDTFIGAIIPSGDYIILKNDFKYYERLNSVVVHPGKGWMYYTVADYISPYVGRSDMDGENSVKLITGNHVVTPDGLAIDYMKGHLYWSDAYFDTIIRCDFDGNNCVTIVNMTNTYRNEEIRDTVIDGNYLYYSAYKKDHVIRVDLTDAPTTVTRRAVGQNPGLGKLDTIAYYYSKNTNVQPMSPGCKLNGLGDCSTICLPTPNGGRTCACERGVSLKPDGRACANVYQCTDVIKQTVKLVTNKEKMIDITFDYACLRYLNDKCDYRCPTNFIPLYSNTMLTCTKVGWDLESKPLCKEMRCPVDIKHGKISDSCNREIGEKCDYTCDAGYTKSEKTAVCTKHGGGTYHVTDDELCTPFQCNATIAHGKLEKDCTRYVGSSCKYTCDKYYTAADKKSTAVCQVGGWNPTNLCSERMCDDGSLSNGAVSSSCTKQVGQACLYNCNQGYANTTAMTVCKNDYKWHPEKTCMPVQCPSTIPYGNILVTGTCDLSIGAVCRFVCNRGYAAANLDAKLLCKDTGMWNVTDGLCAEVAIKPKGQTGGNDISTPGVAVGIVVLVLIIIALVVAIIYLVRRNTTKSSSKYASASFHQNGSGGGGGGGIAIENPGYLQTNEPTIQVKDEHPYSSVDPSQMQPVSFADGAGAGDDGIVNPMYQKEPLPDVGHVEMNQDKTVLTYDSWLKEREKEKAAQS